MVDCLIEIGTEELPPKSLVNLSESFASELQMQLSSNSIASEKIHAYCSPRRLALLIHNISLKQEDRAQERRGPAVRTAYDTDGNPTKAGLGFAHSCQVPFESLEILESDKGKWLVYRETKGGQPTEELLLDVLKLALDKLPIAKRMRWGAGSTEFVRPVHWVMVRLGDKLIQGEVLSQQTISHSYGHRFHAPGALYIEQCAHYVQVLQTVGQVRVVAAERRDFIKQAAYHIAHSKNLVPILDEDLLTEVAGLVEWPVPMLGQFDAQFLSVPREVIISAMQGHQKYFPTCNQDGALQAYFIFMSNLDSPEPEQIVAGNERVLRARLADAKFFYEKDLKTTLASRTPDLEKIVYQKTLGSMAQKVQRLSLLLAELEAQLNQDFTEAKRAALLCKNDLVTEMVGEFPDLQGIMGRYYALEQGESLSVAQVIEEHYWPRFSGDRLPNTRQGQVLALADRVDHLVGILATGHRPSGDKDPFALRRASLGVIRLIIESQIRVSIDWLFQTSLMTYQNDKLDLDLIYIRQYFFDRLKSYYLEQEIPLTYYQAVLALEIDDLVDFEMRLIALKDFASSAAATSLSAANKRVINILKKADQQSDYEIDLSLLTEKAEKALVEELNFRTEKIDGFIQEGFYPQTLSLLSGMASSIDEFFESILVLHDDPKIKNNRLKILMQLRAQLMSVGDLSKLN